MIWLGVDTGGTFTDFVCFDAKTGVRVHKVLSTPHAPEEAILQGICELGLSLDRLRVVHGSTVATNAALEGKGVRTVFVTNRGFADLLSIGRQARRELYELRPEKRPPPVPPELCLETGGRIDATGEVIEPLTAADIGELAARLQALSPQAVAINLLFSYLRPELEQRLRGAVPDGCFCSLSSEVLPEAREYERGMATWLNAWLGPLVEGYLRRLGDQLPGVPLSVMQSAGETVAASQAAGQAVRMLLSGPAGGLVGAQAVAAQAGFDRLLSFDMGGTSTDVALIEGELQLTTEGHIGDYPVAVPMMDMHTIGAGGGSIAWLDEGGMLQVGPASAGADPGPACYGRGGTCPTVTDANLLLGRLRSSAFLGGGMTLDEAAAERAMSSIAGALRTDVLGARVRSSISPMRAWRGPCAPYRSSAAWTRVNTCWSPSVARAACTSANWRRSWACGVPWCRCGEASFSCSACWRRNPAGSCHAPSCSASMTRPGWPAACGRNWIACGSRRPRRSPLKASGWRRASSGYRWTCATGGSPIP